MSDREGPLQDPDAARVEALHRMGVRPPRSPDAVKRLMALTADTVGADVASLVMVGHEQAWVMATTAGRAGRQDAPRAHALADLAVRGSDPLVVRVVSGVEDWSRHPALRGLARPATVAAQVVRAPGGERIGAVEVAWEGERDLDRSARRALARSASLATDLLALQAEASEYGRFIDLNPDPIVIVDVEGGIEQVNTAFELLIGAARPAELIGRGFLELVHRTDRARATAQLARALLMNRRHSRLKLSLVAADGRVVPCEVSIGHLRGVTRHVQLVVHDLSEQLRIEDEHSQLSEQLARAQRLDSVGQIAGGLAHDLNNLLVVMLSNLGLATESLARAQDSGKPDDLLAVAEDLGELGLAIDRASGLTSQLLDFARQEEGANEQADVVEVLDTVRGLISRSVGADISLRFDRPEELPRVAVDPRQLERVLVNLIINARDAIDGIGTIEVRASLVAAGDGQPAAPGDGAHGQSRSTWRPSPSQDAIRIEVADDGCGMSEAVRARAFEPLFTTKAGAGGSGLGLATVQAFVDQVDGRVTLDSSEGAGTTVSLLLPAGDAEVAAVPVGVDVPVAGARILLVDPGDRTRRVIHAMLTGAGYRVTAVPSGEEALAALLDEGVDLLVTELALPGVPGTRLIQAVAQDHPGVRCIALASVDQPQMLNGTPVLVKPFSHTRLLRTVERVARGR